MSDQDAKILTGAFGTRNGGSHLLDPTGLGADSIWGAGQSTGSLLTKIIECLAPNPETPTVCSMPDLSGFMDAYDILLNRSQKDPDALKACELIRDRINDLVSYNQVYSICLKVLPYWHEGQEKPHWGPLVTPALERAFEQRREQTEIVIATDIQACALLFTHAETGSADQATKFKKLLETLEVYLEYEDALCGISIFVETINDIHAEIISNKDNLREILLLALGKCDAIAEEIGISDLQESIDRIRELSEDLDEVDEFANTIIESYTKDQDNIRKKPPIKFADFSALFSMLTAPSGQASPASSQAEAASSDTSTKPRPAP